MNAAQHTFFSALVQGANEAHTELNVIAGDVLGFLLLGGLIGLGLVWVWVLFGGLSSFGALDTPQGRRAMADWLREP